MGFFDKVKNAIGGAAKQAQDAVQQQVNPQQQQQQQQYAQQPAPPPQEHHEEPAADDDDGERRDYDLEAKDDQAGFDLMGDLPKWYVAEFRIEQAWEDEGTRAQLLASTACATSQHYRQVKATVDRFIQIAAGASQVRRRERHHARQDEGHAGLHDGGHAGADCGGRKARGRSGARRRHRARLWAEQMVRSINGATPDDICKGLGIDKAKWDRVSAEWNARMSRDTTATIATAYGNAFTKAQAKPGVGNSPYAAAAQNPGKGDMPMPFDRYVEIMEAQNALTLQGQDPQAVLKKLGITVLDWSNLGAWFSAYINENALRNDGAVHKEFTRLSEMYKAKYASVKSDADISF